MTPRLWISSTEFASAAQIERQVANRVCSGFANQTKGSWRGHVLEVRTVHGKGGRSGIQYQVRISSLPPEIQARLKTHQADVEEVSNTRLGKDAQNERNWKYDVIRPVLQHPKRSVERRDALEALIGTSRLDWKLRQRKLTRTGLYKWIQEYETGGIHALSSKVRSDKGQKRVIINRTWCETVPFETGEMEKIEKQLIAYIRGLVKGGTRRKMIRFLAGNHLKKLTREAGFKPNSPRFERKLFNIPHDMVTAERRYYAVYRHKHDRKASEDGKPRIQRSIDGLVPMEIVVMDVHHINVLVRRENGTAATPKLLAFLDLATNRLFYKLVFFEARGGVRNTDVIGAFVEMCKDPAFGVPQYLYCDNGSEYRFADYLEDALKLSTHITSYQDEDDRNRVIRALPYNAAAKQVEGLFRQLNQQLFRHLKGFIDDDRMNPKRQSLSKAPQVDERGFDAFCQDIDKLMNTYDAVPQQGALKGRSPAEVFQSHVESGWQATVMDDAQLLTVFTKPITRKVQKHAISLNGQRWTCKELAACHETTVVAHVPQYHGFSRVLVTDGKGNPIGIASADKAYHPRDRRGAQDSARRISIRNKSLRDLDKSAPDIDVAAELMAIGENVLPVVPNDPDAVISINRKVQDGLAITPVSVNPESEKQREQEQRESNERALALIEQISKRKAL